MFLWDTQMERNYEHVTEKDNMAACLGVAICVS